ncbi:MAG: diguanylate cyclase, partial [Candidatus Omnitrophica bacterium]|nr:diguanylate cyclase [Candidatus Omnitrophota bacterium]
RRLKSAIATGSDRATSEEILLNNDPTVSSDAHYRVLLDSMGDPIHVIDRNFNIVLFNKPFEQWIQNFHIVIDDCTSKSVFDVFPFLPAAVKDEYVHVFKSGKTLVTEEETIIGNKKILTETRKIPIFNNGVAERVITVLRDVTERRSIETQLMQHVLFEKLITTISSNFTNIAIVNIDREISEALRAIGMFMGVDRVYILLTYDNNTKADNTYEWCAAGVSSQMETLQGIPASHYPWFSKKITNSDIIHVRNLDDFPHDATLERQLFSTLKLKTMICIPMICEQNVIGVLGFDSHKEKTWTDNTIALLKIVGSIFANTLKRVRTETERALLNRELKRSNRKLRQVALRDVQTGLFNHNYLNAVIEQEFFRARRYYKAISAIMVDIDYFKSINDLYGYAFGDLVLKQFARHLRKIVRRYDILVRFGGEEFIIICPALDRANALGLAQRILEVINICNFGDKKNTVKLKISLGVAAYPEDTVTKGIELIELAERILNKTKECGGNNIYSSIDMDHEQPRIVIPHKNQMVILEKKIAKLTKRENQGLIEAVFAFARTIELKDHYTGEHVERTVGYAAGIARRLGLAKLEIEIIRKAAMLHDLGKIGLSEKILLKEGKLTVEEYEEVKRHPRIGADIIRPVQMLHDLVPLILHHHERWDGTGYPDGLRAEEIPLGARIVALADVYQALVSDRPYRPAFSKEKALEIINEGSGTQFDPSIVTAFLQVIEADKRQ